MKTIQSKKMNTKASNAVSGSWWAAPVACLVTLMALPVNAALQIPDEPLSTGGRVAPNILFILDDSGSMAWDYMPDTLPRVSGDVDPQFTYARNSVHYDPRRTYRPWVNFDGTRMTGGMSYTSVYADANMVGTNSSTDNLSRSVRTFYVPKDMARTDEAYLSNGSNYYRYQITSGSSPKLVRSDTGSNATGFPKEGVSGTSLWQYFQVTVPAGTQTLEVTFMGGTGDGDLYVRRGQNPTLSSYTCISNRYLNNETCTINSPTAGTYNIGIYRSSSYANGTLNATLIGEYCPNESTWANCTDITPTGRTVADELVNYATWYSYHRTRMKTAKAGAGEAFVTQDRKVRVGFRTIHRRNDYDIQVNDGNDGRFENRAAATGVTATTTRSTWFTRLYGAAGNSGTPLLGALEDAGKYFSKEGGGIDPYGPETGANQYSCRQNFTILTTDGLYDDVTYIGEHDNTAGPTVTGPNGRTYRYAPTAPYSSSVSNTLADIAMYYWKNDLVSTLENNVPTTTGRNPNPAFWQHMVTFGISIGLKGTLDQSSVSDFFTTNADGTVSVVPPKKNGATVPWPNTGQYKMENIDDLLHAALNGRGEFISAVKPEEFAEGLSAALASISERTSSYSNVATNSASLDTGALAFNANYVSGAWTGNLTARSVSDSGLSSTVSWSASIPQWSSRRIYTSNGTSGSDFPTAAQLPSLARTGAPTDYPVSGLDNANYIKGDRSKEGGAANLRQRDSVLGDIIGSSPAYVKETNTLYVGANDGMLHAFNAANGQELFAYIPNIISWGNLATLSKGNYSHKYFVDGPIAVTSRALTPNANILVGALGRGGKGLYALDVTNTAATAAQMFKWERAETTGNNMGLVLGMPILARTQDGNKSVIVANGVNSTNDKAVLIILNVETGQVIREIDTGAGTAANPNGLSAPTAVYGPDGKTVAYVYAGDMLGNVWKFDLTSASPASWTVSRLFTTAANQPISGAVTVALDPSTYKRWVFFGTGRYLVASDISATANAYVQSMYGFIDDGTGAAVARTDLTQRTFATTSATFGGNPVRAFESNTALPTNSKGWYINLPEKGERIVQDAQIAGGFLVTASMIPEGNACGADGRGYLNALDAFTGTSAKSSFFDLNGDGSTDDSAVSNRPVGSADIGVGMPTLPNLMRGLTVVGGTSGSTNAIRTKRPSWNRLSWRELRED